MPRRNRRVAPTQSHRRGHREHRPNVFMGEVPDNPETDDEDVLLDDVDLDEGDEAESSDPAGDGAVAAPSRSARGSRSERRRAARARRGAGARNRAVVFTQHLPAELKKLGVLVGGTTVILVVLTVVLG